MNGSIKYKIYPSLLDKFQDYLDSDIVAEESWNKDAEGSYRLTPDEMSDKLEQELLDAVNRVPHDPIEAADKGTCFNEIVDCIAANIPCGHEGMQLVSDRKAGTVTACLHGFTFVFDLKMCLDAASYFRGAVSQHFCDAVMETRYGLVELYGFADEIVRDRVYDIKTTSSYAFGKFERKWQRHVYPWCLIESGEMDSVSMFEYTVFQLGKGTLITGKMYMEQYTYSHDSTTELLRSHVEHFVEWLEMNRMRITDRKIFNMPAEGQQA